MVSVTVVIPTYNRENVLPRAIDSVLGQRFEDFELIVVDDGSTDNTEGVVKSYSDDRISYICLEQNSGANTARNRGVDAANGTFISFLDSDDEFTQNHLERVVSYLDQSSGDVAGVFTSEKQVRNGEEIDLNMSRQKLVKPEEVIQDYPAGGFSSLTFQKNIFDKVGYLDESLGGFQDREFLVRVLDFFEIHPIPEKLVVYHIHDSGISGNASRKLSALEKFIKKHRQRFGPKEWAHMHYTRAFLNYQNGGDMAKTRRGFYKAVRKNPRRSRYYLQLGFSLLGRPGFKYMNNLKRKCKNTVVNVKGKTVS